MAKQDEALYLSRIGPDGYRHAKGKPWSDANCDRYLIQFGAILSLLPPPPARLLDMGCGTGWTSIFFAKRGFDVCGVDISGDMIRAAEENQKNAEVGNLEFLAGDYESVRLPHTFDCVVFFDSLHHSDDEFAALKTAYDHLKLGGVCILSEPGHGHSHADASQRASTEFGVTEKDMPPTRIWTGAKRIGFSRCRVYPNANTLGHGIYDRSLGANLPSRSRFCGWYYYLAGLFAYIKSGSGWRKRGLVVLVK